MYSLRIHSLDLATTTAAEATTTTAEASSSSSSSPNIPSSSTTLARNPNFKTLETKGIVHLYREASSSPSSSSASADPSPILPVCRGTLLFVVAVPSSLSVDDFLRFCRAAHTEHFLELRIISNDLDEDRYSVLILVNDQKSADNFYLSVSGWRFPSAEEEVCHILFMDSVDYSDSTEIAATPPAGSTELPTCPVCLERLDQDTSGIVTTGCDHSFQCSCIPKWANSSCRVCCFCQEHSEKPTCSICETTENLWICMICSFIGCGRYKEGHAIRHWKDTQHSYSLDLGTQRVWDYVGDTYVHRLNLSKSDGEMVKSKHGCMSADSHCGTCECSEDPGIEGDLFSSKVEAIEDEYNLLLGSQLETQREYYESLIVEAREEEEKLITEAVEKALSTKMQNIQLEIEKTIKENKTIADMNDKHVKDQKLWQEKLKEIEERTKSTLRLKEEKIRDMEEEIRDFTVYLHAQKVIENVADADDIKEGTILPIPLQQPSTTNPRKASRRINRRRH